MPDRYFWPVPFSAFVRMVQCLARFAKREHARGSDSFVNIGTVHSQ